MGPSSRAAGRPVVPSLRLAGAGLAAAAALGTLGVLAAGAAVQAAAASTTATVTWSDGEFGATPGLHVGDAVRFKNNSPQALHVEATSSNWSFSADVPANGTSRARTFTSAGSYKFSGETGLILTQKDTGTITVTAPKPSATPTHTQSSNPPKSPPPKSPKPDQSTPQGGGKHHHGGTAPTPAPVGGIGSAGNPALGAGQLVPPPGYGGGDGNQPTPEVAPGLTPAPAPTASVDAFGDPVVAEGTTLAQPVPARRYGLPGAVAAVLVAGALVGVVRLAKAEYGTPPDPGTS